MSDRIIISQDEATGEWVADTVSVPDPNGWGEINSFQMLENSKGTTEYDDNFVKAIPGYTPQTDWSEILVIPNPFIRHSAYESNEYELKWMIRGLPADCIIKIYTVTGKLVKTIDLTGREISPNTKRNITLQLFDNGTVEQKYIIK